MPRSSPDADGWYTVVHQAKPWSLNEELGWHRMERHRHVAEWRKAFGYLGMQLPRLQRVEVEVVAHGVRYDITNVAGCSKAAIDGIVDSGALPDDTPAHVVGVMFRPNVPGRPALEVRLRPV
jgi:hypothetical protein